MTPKAAPHEDAIPSWGLNLGIQPPRVGAKHGEEPGPPHPPTASAGLLPPTTPAPTCPPVNAILKVAPVVPN